MLFSDTYKTILKPSEGIFRDRGSKFIGYAYPIRHEEDTKELLNKVKAEHPKARHHCWAFRLTPDRTVFRLNDDSEPSGTAGRPILNTLLSADVTNVFVVVVRYFGGTLLGVPGLINAYKTAAAEALNNAEVIEKTVNDIYRVRFEYLQMNDIMRIVKEESLLVLDQQFDNNCLLEFEMRQSQTNQVLNKLGKVENTSIEFVGVV
ncbi:MAG TPA: YigZ family protein [Sphingobacteriaceae bacterium]